MEAKKIKIELENDEYVLITARAHKVTLSLYPVESTISDLYAKAVVHLGSKAEAFAKAIHEASELAWPGIKAKLADSDASDYYEYYDSKKDVEYELNGWQDEVDMMGYQGDDVASYDFNKRRMQSYLHDIG